MICTMHCSIYGGIHNVDLYLNRMHKEINAFEFRVDQCGPRLRLVISNDLVTVELSWRIISSMFVMFLFLIQLLFA